MGPLLGCGGGESYFHEFLVLSLAAALHDQANTAVGDPARAAADSAIGKGVEPALHKQGLDRAAGQPLRLADAGLWLVCSGRSGVQVATPPFDWAAIQPHVDELIRRTDRCTVLLHDTTNPESYNIFMAIHVVGL
eukprot:COSAG01_NODE_12059_length_1806_cov_6.421207_1_plen_135_part_00